MTQSTIVLKVPIASTFVPNVFVGVNLRGSSSHAATGTLVLRVPPTNRTLAVRIMPAQSRVAPGSTTVDVEVKDAEGNPVADAEVAIIMVEQAALALSDYAMVDPMAIFYADRDEGLRAHHLRAHVDGVNSKVLETTSATEVDEGFVPKRRGPLTYGTYLRTSRQTSAQAAASRQAARVIYAPRVLRTNVNPLFAPEEKTDSSGKIRLKITLPDHAAEYRIMVVAAHGHDQFGASESSMTTLRLE